MGLFTQFTNNKIHNIPQIYWYQDLMTKSLQGHEQRPEKEYLYLNI